MGSGVLMEIPIAMIVASRLLPFRANRLAIIIAGTLLALINGFLTFVCASARVGPATCFCRAPVLRNERNRVHLGHNLAGVDPVRARIQ